MKPECSVLFKHSTIHRRYQCKYVLVFVGVHVCVCVYVLTCACAHMCMCVCVCSCACAQVCVTTCGTTFHIPKKLPVPSVDVDKHITGLYAHAER